MYIYVCLYCILYILYVCIGVYTITKNLQQLKTQKSILKKVVFEKKCSQILLIVTIIFPQYSYKLIPDHNTKINRHNLKISPSV